MTPTAASEDFASMLRGAGRLYPDRYGDVEGEGACEVHNPGYDFNDAALPYGSGLLVKLLEKRLGRLTG